MIASMLHIDIILRVGRTLMADLNVGRPVGREFRRVVIQPVIVERRQLQGCHLYLLPDQNYPIL
jgi:hypothetical protein